MRGRRRHFALMAWFTKKFLFAFDLKNVHATYFIAYVGIIVASLTSADLRHAGFRKRPVLVRVRLLRRPVRARDRSLRPHEVAAPAKPTFCVYAAPMSLFACGYLAVTPDPDLTLVTVMAVAAQALFVFVLAQVPKFVKGRLLPELRRDDLPLRHHRDRPRPRVGP